MTTFDKLAVLVLMLAGLAAVAFLVMVPAQPPPAPSPLQARTLAALQRPIDMPFADETPLEDVLKYIKLSTVSPDLPAGIPIYIDPVGLQEAEKSESSPVRINLAGIPLSSTLPLLLHQVDLRAFVQADGVLVITSHDTASLALSTTSTLVGARQLDAELAEIEARIQALRSAGPSKGRTSGKFW